MTLFARGFRPFFLLASAHAVLFVPLWVAMLRGWMPLPSWLAPPLWHAHEMLFGFCSAAIAGFLLTSVPVWTATSPIAGVRLALLAALWLAGRLALSLPGCNAALAAGVDLAFLPALALSIAPALHRARAPRNLGFPVMLLTLAAANALMHAEALALTASTAKPGARLAVDLISLLIVVIGGRIIPAFTTGALRRAGVRLDARAPAVAERAAVPAMLLFAAADLGAPESLVSGACAALAAAVLALRMTGWKSRRVLADPLLGSLHLGHAWVVVGLACVAASDLVAAFPPSIAVHALTAGAFGSMILAVMTRVALGHTGRPLVAPASAVLAYGLVTAGALLRTLGVAAMPSASFLVLTLAGALWAGAFGAFLVGYTRILCTPRVDGAAG